MATRTRLSPILVAVAAAFLVAADAVGAHSARWRACGHGASPVAIGLAAASAVLVVAAMVALLVGWVGQSVSGDRRLGRGRALTLVLAVIVLLGVVVSIAVMGVSETLSTCS
jgi:hypothetical protein